MRNYGKIAASIIFVTGIMSAIASATFAYSSGPPDGRTGSPADSLQTCNDTGCHNNYALNSGSAAFSISAPSTYTLGEVLSITVSFSNSTTANPTFAIRGEKRLFLGMNRHETIDFKGMDIQKGL